MYMYMSLPFIFLQILDGDLDWFGPSFIPWLATLSIVIFFWTSAIFSNLQKVTISGVVGEWYFQEYVLSVLAYNVCIIHAQCVEVETTFPQDILFGETSSLPRQRRLGPFALLL